MLENVASLIHPTHRRLFERVLEGARSAGYAIAWKVCNSAEFGVPQTRHRVFVLGIRGKHPPKFPNPTHFWQAHGNGDARRLKPPETAGRWIRLLDRAELFEPEEVVQGRWERQLREIPPGWNYKYLTSWAGHPSPLFVTETKYWTFLLKLSPFRPSWTIQASAGPWTGPFHWRNRRLRISELAVLQTFPMSYKFAGTRRAQRSQIGNAVPCLMASKIAAALLEEVLDSRPRRGRRLRYAIADRYPFKPELLRHNGPRW